MRHKHPTAVAVVARVAALYGLDEADLWSTSRSSTVMEARHVCCWKLRQETGWSSVEIGRAMGKDHSSVLHSLKVACAKLEQGSGTPYLQSASQVLRIPWIVGATAAEFVGGIGAKPEDRPPSLVLSPSESGPQVVFLSESSPAPSSDPRPDKKRARARKVEPETDPPEHLAPTARQVEIAQKSNIDLATEIERFLNHHRGKGNKMARWSAGLTTWLLSPYPKALIGQSQGKSSAKPGDNFNRLKDLAEQLELEEKRNAAQ